LVLLHGTFSSIQGSFGTLFCSPDQSIPTPQAQSLQTHYGARILGLEHRTLSVSPIQNALDLVQQLPRGARLHLVSHSRGGLIGDLLTASQLTQQNLEPFYRQQRTEEAEQLTQLSRYLREKELRIERFVRVACPARGTNLVSQRLDRYLSVLLNLIGMIPAVQTTPLYSFAKATILSLIQQRTDPRALPGLEAMMPTAPLIQLLNHSGVTTGTDLAVIAGDIEGGSLLRRLGILATDLFYWQDHDFVVQSSSMFKGLDRTRGVYYSFEKGPRITHFNYFANPQSRQRIHDWLIREGEEAPQSFQKLVGEPIPELVRSALRSPKADAPVIFVIPDLMATQLRRNDRCLWLDLDELASGALEQLALNGKQQEVLVGDLFAPSYQPILNYLAKRFDVRPFPYDWRRSLLETAEQLAAVVSMELQSHERPIYLLAHGSGGLAARAMIAQHNDLWRRLVARNGRLVMVGTPQRGTHFALQLLSGQGRPSELLTLLHPQRGQSDADHEQPDGANEPSGAKAKARKGKSAAPKAAAADRSSVAAIACTWPGLLELLPSGTAQKVSAAWLEQRDITKQNLQETMAALSALLTLPDGKIADLAHGVDPAHMCIVAGSGTWTAQSADPDQDALVLQGNDAGDGVTSLPSALLAGVQTWYLRSTHGDLIHQQAVLPAIAELIEHGSTNLLSQTPERDIASAVTREAPQPAPLYPTAEETIAAVLGFQSPKIVAKERVRLRVAVVHGNIAYAKQPVAVGHYDGDMIAGGEAALDRLLDNRLSIRNAMHIYPGKEGTVEFVRGTSGTFPGVLIIGLGEIGGILPDVLTKGITEVLLRLAMYVLERPPSAEDSGQWRSAAFSSMLIGT
ncbi:MAG: hypothetical protein KDE53_34980, partial [Caldilineaceae bacterium]|nr:hypothetical protein [Caldilineaceae bacterium]